MNKSKKLHIFHILFTRQMGGLEQTYIDYTKILTMRGHKVTAVVSPDAPYIYEMERLGAEIIKLNTRGFYDIFAWVKLYFLLRTNKPDLILAHN